MSICPLAATARKHPQATALIDEVSGQTYTFSELNELVQRMVAYLSDSGVAEGDRVAVLSENSVSYIAILFAAPRLKASTLLLSLKLSADDWRRQMDEAHCRYLCVSNAYKYELTNVEAEMVVLEEGVSSPAQEEDTKSTNEQLDSEREAISIFTSSTVGHTKGVKLSYNNFFHSASASNGLTKLSSNDCWLLSMPLYHVAGLGILYRTVLAGASVRLISDFSRKRISERIISSEVTHLSLVPTMLGELLDQFEALELGISSSISNLKAIILAGAASSETLKTRIIQYNVPVLSAWGMTETTAHCTCMSLEDPVERVATVGKPFPHTEVNIVDDLGNLLEAGEIGEIVVSGPTVCLGYLGSGAPLDAVKNGALYTGDLGVFDTDGYLTIIGRKDDMFISGGENIHIGEIESVAESFEGAKQCAVIAISDEKWGQRPILYVQADSEESLDTEDYMNFLKKRLARMKLPDRIIQVPDLPRTAIGKIDYKRLRKTYLS